MGIEVLGVEPRSPGDERAATSSAHSPSERRDAAASVLLYATMDLLADTSGMPLHMIEPPRHERPLAATVAVGVPCVGLMELDLEKGQFHLNVLRAPYGLMHALAQLAPATPNAGEDETPRVGRPQELHADRARAPGRPHEPLFPPASRPWRVRPTPCCCPACAKPQPPKLSRPSPAPHWTPPDTDPPHRAPAL